MIIFANEDGSIAAVSPSRITQGSVDANKIVLVGPFSNSVVTIAFTLPNGIVLGPNIAGLPEEYTPTEDEDYTMTELNGGEAVHTDTGLFAYSYTLNKSLTSMSGTLGIQFFISTNRDTYTDTLATNKVNVPIYNGSRYIPDIDVPTSSDELIKLLANINAALANAIKSDSKGQPQSIQSDLGVKGDLDVDGELDVGGNSNLGRTAKVVNADGIPTVTIYGATGSVEASLIRANGATFMDSVDAGTVDADYASIEQADIPTLLVTLIKALGDTGLIQFTDDGNGNASMWVGPTSEITKVSTEKNTAIRVQNIIVDAIALIKDTLTVETTLDAQGDATVRGTLSVGGKLSALGDLDVGGKSTLGHTAEVLNAEGTPKVTLYGNTGMVSASSVVTDTSNTGKLFTNRISSSLAAPIRISREFFGEEEKTTLDLHGSLVVSDNVDVGGNLNVKGKTINQIQESIIVSDNIIVTNSSGAGFSVSGIVMRTSLPNENAPNNPSEAYGILYSPTDEAVMIGKGTLTEIPNVTTGAVTYEFTFTEGEALPLAARYGFSDTQDAVVPIWNSEKNAFSPSPIKFNGDEAHIPSISTDRIYGALVRATRLNAGSSNKTENAGTGSFVVMGNGNEIQDRAQNAYLIGEDLKTRFSNQQIVGKFNFITNTLMWSCGNGKSETERSNAFGTDYSGNLLISNEAYVYRRGRGVNGGATGSSNGRIRLLREDERVWNSDYAARASLEDIYMAVDWNPVPSELGGLLIYGLRSPRQNVYKCYAHSGVEFYTDITVGNMSFNRFENIEFIFNGSSISKVFAIGFNGNSPIGTPVDITNVGTFSIPFNDPRYFY